MKHLEWSIVVALVVMVVGSVPVAAQTTSAEVSAGITADSPLWGIDVALDNIRLALATTDDAKARAGLEIAAERLAEIKASAEAGKLDAVQKSEREHEKNLAEVKARIKAMKRDRPEEDLEATVELEEDVEAHAEAIEDVRSDIEVRLRVRGELTEQQRELLSAFLTSLENSTADVRVEIKEKKGEVRARLKARGLTETEINEIVNETERREGLHEFFKERATERIEDAKEAIAEAKEAAAELSADLNASANASVNVTADRLAAGLHLIERAEFHLNVSESAFAEGQYGKAFGQATAAFHIARNAERVLTAEIDVEDGVDETEEVEERHREEIEIEIEIENNITHVEVRVRRNGFREEVEFDLNTTDRDTIVAEIDARTSLTREEVEKLIGPDLTVQTEFRAKFEQDFQKLRNRLEAKIRQRAMIDIEDLDDDENETKDDDDEENETEDED